MRRSIVDEDMGVEDACCACLLETKAIALVCHAARTASS
jgi:hypothetical protein